MECIGWGADARSAALDTCVRYAPNAAAERVSTERQSMAHPRYERNHYGEH